MKIAHNGQTRITRRIITGLGKLAVLAWMVAGYSFANADTNSIENIQYSTLPGNRLQIVLTMSAEAVKPLSFTIDNPARIAFDFSNTTSKLPKRSQPSGIGIPKAKMC